MRLTTPTQKVKDFEALKERVRAGEQGASQEYARALGLMAELACTLVHKQERELKAAKVKADAKGKKQPQAAWSEYSA